MIAYGEKANSNPMALATEGDMPRSVRHRLAIRYARSGQPRVDPPPAVLDGALDLHQVLERVAVEVDRRSKVSPPASEEEEEECKDCPGLR